MLSLRALCNLFSQPSGEALALRECQRLLAATHRRAAAGGANKNTQIALATLALNFAVALRRAAAEGDSEAPQQLLTIVTTAAPQLTDGEAQFRLLVAAGTICTDNEEVCNLARVLGIPAVVQKWAQVEMPEKVGRCARQLLAVLR